MRALRCLLHTCLHPGVKGDAEALKIRDPQFTVHTIVQSSSTPCDLNTIAVTLRSNVPLFAACKPRVTMTGLVGSDTASFPRQYKTEYTNCSIPNCNGTVAMIGSRPVPVQGCTYSFTKLDGIDQYDGLQGVLTGEDACVGHGWLEPQCRAVGCCLWNAGSGCQRFWVMPAVEASGMRKAISGWQLDVTSYNAAFIASEKSFRWMPARQDQL